MSDTSPAVPEPVAPASAPEAPSANAPASAANPSSVGADILAQPFAGIPPVESTPPAAPEHATASSDAPAPAVDGPAALPVAKESSIVPQRAPVVVDHSKMHLGRRRQKIDGRTLWLGKYLGGRKSKILQHPFAKMLHEQRVEHWRKSKEIRRALALSGHLGAMSPLGEQARQHDLAAHVLGMQIAAAVSAEVDPATIPATRDWTVGIASWPMLLNDQLEDCTIAGKLHMKQAMVKAAGGDYQPTDAEALADYAFFDGYKPGVPSTDQGGVMLDVLNAAVKRGDIVAFMAVDCKDATQVKAAIDKFGGLYAGWALPLAAQSQRTWDTTAPGDPKGVAWSWGGHEAPILQYDGDGTGIVTWGMLKRATWSWVPAYGEEGYAIVSKDFLSARGVDPDGFDMDALMADLQQVQAL
jgi:hypothetical protein